MVIRRWFSWIFGRSGSLICHSLGTVQGGYGTKQSGQQDEESDRRPDDNLPRDGWRIRRYCEKKLGTLFAMRAGD